MTIAACYLSTEGVVFGADSTTTMYVRGVGPGAVGAEHHYNFAQKIFQVGENSTLAMTMWGLGNLGTTSYRTLIAQFADVLAGQGVQSLRSVADLWSQFFWSAYAAELEPQIRLAQSLRALPTRTPEQQEELAFLLQAFSGGFCVGGYLLNDRTPNAFEILYSPTMAAPAPADALRMGSTWRVQFV